MNPSKPAARDFTAATNYDVPSATSIACRRCGRLTYPHVCESIMHPDGPLQPIVAIELQCRVLYEWVDLEPREAEVGHAE